MSIFDITEEIQKFETLVGSQMNVRLNPCVVGSIRKFFNLPKGSKPDDALDLIKHIIRNIEVDTFVEEESRNEYFKKYIPRFIDIQRTSIYGVMTFKIIVETSSHKELNLAKVQMLSEVPEELLKTIRRRGYDYRSGF